MPTDYPQFSAKIMDLQQNKEVYHGRIDDTCILTPATGATIL